MNPDLPLSWIIKGDRDLAVCNDLLSKWANYPDLIAYHSQQASEKYLKALLVHYGQPMKRTHDLEELLDLLLPFVSSITNIHYNHAAQLNGYAIFTRYPGADPDPTEAEIRQAIQASEYFREFAVSIVPHS